MEYRDIQIRKKKDSSPWYAGIYDNNGYEIGAINVEMFFEANYDVTFSAEELIAIGNYMNSIPQSKDGENKT